MKGIENRIEIEASPRIVYKHLSNPQNIPLFVPGIRNATVIDWREEGIGTRVSLTTRHDHHREAVITEESERRFLAIQDDHGTVNEWEIRRAPGGGTTAVNRILGEFPEDRAATLATEARVKLYAFKDFVEDRQNGHRPF